MSEETPADDNGGDNGESGSGSYKEPTAKEKAKGHADDAKRLAEESK